MGNYLLFLRRNCYVAEVLSHYFFLCMRKELQNVHFVLSSVAKFDIFCDHPIPVLYAVLGSV